MNHMNEKLKTFSKVSTTWREKAEHRRQNKWQEYSSQIARRVLAVIKSKEDLNQAKLAEALGVTPQQISKIVKGQENLTLETIYKLSQALGLELISFPEYEYSITSSSDFKRIFSNNSPVMEVVREDYRHDSQGIIGELMGDVDRGHSLFLSDVSTFHSAQYPLAK